MENTDMLSSDSRASWTSIAVKNGIILGLVSTVIGLITLLTKTSGNFLFGLISLVITIFLVVVCNRDFKKQNGGFMSYGQGFKLTFLMVLIGGIISALITFVYLAVIDPGAIESMKEAKIEAVEKMASMFGASMPEEEMDKAVAKIEAETTATGTFTESLMGSAFGALLLALIIPAFTKHTRPEYE
jgi:hypothetical protein